MSHEVVTDWRRRINSEPIVSFAKQALYNLPYYMGWYETIGKEKFYHEFREIKIKLPRRSGHSTAALQLLYEYPDALCFVRGFAVRDMFRSLLRENTSDGETLQRIDKQVKVIDFTEPLDNLMVRRIMSNVTHNEKRRSFIIFDQASELEIRTKETIIDNFPSEITLELG